MPPNIKKTEATIALNKIFSVCLVGICDERFNNARPFGFFGKNADATIFEDGVSLPQYERLDIKSGEKLSLSAAMRKLEEWFPQAFKNEPNSSPNVVFVCLGIEPSAELVGDHVIYTNTTLTPAEIFEHIYQYVKSGDEESEGEEGN